MEHQCVKEEEMIMARGKRLGQCLGGEVGDG